MMRRIWKQQHKKRRGAAITLEFALASLVLASIAFLGSKFGNNVIGFFDSLWTSYDGSRIAASQGAVTYNPASGVDLIEGSTGGFSGSGGGTPSGDFMETECTDEATNFADAQINRQTAADYLVDANTYWPESIGDSWVAFDNFRLANEAYDDAVEMEAMEIARAQAILTRTAKIAQRAVKQAQLAGMGSCDSEEESCSDLNLDGDTSDAGECSTSTVTDQGCVDTKNNLQNQISTLGTQIANLTTQITNLTADIANLGANWGTSNSVQTYAVAENYYLTGREQQTEINQGFDTIVDLAEDMNAEILTAEELELEGLQACAQ